MRFNPHNRDDRRRAMKAVESMTKGELYQFDDGDGAFEVIALSEQGDAILVADFRRENDREFYLTFGPEQIRLMLHALDYLQDQRDELRDAARSGERTQNE